jgi:hypothetical protein
MADFFWCMMAAQRGSNIEETAGKQLEVSAKAQDRTRLHGEGYALITAQNAAAPAEGGTLRGRGSSERQPTPSSLVDCTQFKLYSSSN